MALRDASAEDNDILADSERDGKRDSKITNRRRKGRSMKNYVQKSNAFICVHFHKYAKSFHFSLSHIFVLGCGLWLWALPRKFLGLYGDTTINITTGTIININSTVCLLYIYVYYSFSSVPGCCRT